MICRFCKLLRHWWAIDSCSSRTCSPFTRRDFNLLGTSNNMEQNQITFSVWKKTSLNVMIISMSECHLCALHVSCRNWHQCLQTCQSSLNCWLSISQKKMKFYCSGALKLPTAAKHTHSLPRRYVFNGFTHFTSISMLWRSHPGLQTIFYELLHCIETIFQAFVLSKISPFDRS